MGIGGDDFEWMDFWEIHAKDRPTTGANVPNFVGTCSL